MKRICAALCALSLLFMLSGCQGKCDACGEKGIVKKVTFMGESAKLCSDCEALLDMISDY